MNSRPRVWATAAVLCAATATLPLRAARAQSTAAVDSVAVSAAAVSAAAVAAAALAAPVTPAPAAGPRIESASVAVRATAASASAAEPRQDVAERLAAPEASSSSAPTNALPASRNSQGKPKALMIVGGAAFLAGALIGDTAGTAIMIGGAGIGLYGLYLYLQ